MSSDAQKRMQAIEQYAELGSGIKIAMKDLEIRGAGDLLGGEQSGFINDIGFETYQKILKEAVEELKEKEFKNLYAAEENGPKSFIKEVQIDTDLAILLPDDYVNSVSERLSLYNRISELNKEEELLQFQKDLEDRFGPIPSQAEDLLKSIRLKWKALDLGLERLILKRGQLSGYFISDQESEYYQSEAFNTVLQWVQLSAGKVELKEKETRQGLRLRLAIKGIDSVSAALEQLPNL